MATEERSAPVSLDKDWNVVRWCSSTKAWKEELAPGVELTMLEIPAGSFLIGSPTEEPERFEDEGPQQRIDLEDFLLAQTPITQAQWRVVAGWSPGPGERWTMSLNPSPSHFQGKPSDGAEGASGVERGGLHDLLPVEQVSWQEAVEFCNRLRQRTGKAYTLPSEAQWEYACRAGTTTPFHCGETIDSSLANYNASVGYGGGTKGEHRAETTPVGRMGDRGFVGTFPANVWGLHDMHGNVWEWCADAWHPNYNEFCPMEGLGSNREPGKEPRGWCGVAPGISPPTVVALPAVTNTILVTAATASVFAYADYPNEWLPGPEIGRVADSTKCSRMR